MAEKIISKGLYTHPGIPDLVTAKQYVVLKKGKDEQLFFRFENPRNETLTAISFSVDYYSLDGKVVKTKKIEQNNLKVKGNSCFVVNRPAPFDVYYADFKVTINYVRYGNYLYITRGDEIEVIYEKCDSKKDVDRVPFLQKLGGRTHKSTPKTLHSPHFFISLVSVIVLSLFCVLGVKLYNFTRTEEFFTLDKVKYEFATENHTNGPIIFLGTTTDAANIIIPDKIEGHDVISIAPNAFSNSKIRTIKIEGNIEISDNAFANASRLQTIEIEAVQALGNNAFRNCKNLKDVKIKSELQTIGQNAFEECTSLVNVSLPDTVLIVENNAFSNCSSLATLIIPDSVTYIGENVLSDCNSLESLRVPFVGEALDNPKTLKHFYGSVTPSALKNLVIAKSDAVENNQFYGEKTLESIAYLTAITKIESNAFNGCSKLKGFDIPHTVAHIGNGAFSGCTSLEAITIPNSISTLNDSLFNGCRSLKSITLPEGLTYVGSYVFRNCVSLTELPLTSAVTHIGDDAILNCVGLTSLVLPFLSNDAASEPKTLSEIIASGDNCSLESLTVLSCKSLPDDAFSGFKKLASVTLPDELEIISANCFKDCQSLVAVNVPENVTSIGEYAFFGCSALKSVDIPKQVSAAGEYAFANCTSLETAVFRGNSTELNEGVFSACSSLNYIKLPEAIKSIPTKMCEGCSSIESVLIPISVVEIPEQAFFGCSSLRNVVLPLNLTDIGASAFESCTSLPLFEFPRTLKNIGDNAFSECSSLTSVVIPDSVKTVGTSVFGKCSNLGSMSVPFPNCYSEGALFGYYFAENAVPTSLKHVTISKITDQVLPADAFRGCSGIEELILPNTLTSIGQNAFMNCSSLVSLTIPDSVESIDRGILLGTTSLRSITLPYAGSSMDDLSNGFRYFYLDEGSYSFPKALSEVTLTKATIIPEYSFYQIFNLDRVNLPQTLLYIGNQAFGYCTSLNEIILPASLQYVESAAFNECVRLYEATNLSNANVNFRYALRVFSSEAEKLLYKVEVDDYTILYATDGNWYLTDYDEQKNSHDLPSNITWGSEFIEYNLPSHLFYCDSKITEINISANIQKIHSYAFEGCYNLKEVTSEHSDTFEEICKNAFLRSGISYVEIPASTKTIGDYAFTNTNITDVVLPNTLTYIGTNAFGNCTSLKSVTFSDGIQLSGISDYAFSNTGIESIAIPDSVTTIGEYAFQDCYSLKEVSFSDDSQLSDIKSYAFSGSGIEALVLPAYLSSINENALANTYSLKNVSFKENSQLTEINERAFSSSSVESIAFPAALTAIKENAFLYCNSLKSATFPENSNLNEIGTNAFSGTSLESITLPSSLTTLSESAFAYCSSLKSVAFKANSQLNIINAYTFYASGLESITLPASITTINEFAFSSCASLKNVSFEANSLLNEISTYTFYASGLESIMLPASITAINEYAFASCASLKNVTFEANSQLTEISANTFYASGLESITLPATITSIKESAFLSCASLKTVAFEGNSQLTEIKAYAFSASGIESITFPSALTAVYESAFASCSALNSVSFEENCQISEIKSYAFSSSGIENITLPSALERLSDHAFYNCKALKSVSFKNNSRLSEIGQYAFSESTVERIAFPSALTTICSRAFYNCASLNNISFSENSSLSKIESYAFAYSGIESIDLPSSLRNVGSRAFSCCNNLISATLRTYNTNFSTDTFAETNKIFEIYNLTGSSLSVGSESYGSIAKNAIIIHTDENAERLHDVDTNGFLFKKSDDNWFLMGLSENNKPSELVLRSFTYNDEVIDSFIVYNSAFADNTDITSVIIGSAVKEIRTRAFYNCSAISTITFDEDCTFSSISSYAFSYCTSLHSIVLPDSLKTIETYAFYQCERLESVLLPENLERIDSNAFRYCYRLFDVMNLSSLTIEKATRNGYVGYYALSIRKSSTPLQTTVVTSSSSIAKFATNDGKWYLVALDPVSDSSIIEIPNLTVDGYTCNYQIFGYALKLIITYQTEGIIIPNTVTEISNNASSSLRNHNIYFCGTQEEWNDINESITYYVLYTYVDCVHESGTWTYDASGKVVTTPVAMTETVILAPTCKDSGTLKIVCPSCGEEKTEIIPITNDHNFVDNVCTVCEKVRHIDTVTKENFNSLSYITNNSKTKFDIDESGIITSQNHGHSGSSTFTINADKTITVSFDYMVISEENFDWFSVYLNSSLLIHISGKTSYQSYVITLNSGDVLSFEYSKDGSTSKDQDCAYVKNLTIEYIEAN